LQGNLYLADFGGVDPQTGNTVGNCVIKVAPERTSAPVDLRGAL